jgi:hypothetical protein
VGWVSALRSEKVRKLFDQKYLQLSLFDQQNLAEIHSPDFPGERLMACFNPLLAQERKRKRHELPEATEQALESVSKEAKRRTKKPLSAAEIGTKVGKIINRFQMGKHFELSISDGPFSYARRADAIEREAELDGICVIRTSEPRETLSSEDAVRSYKNLAQVERAFRSLKGLDIRIRPIHHRTEDRVRAHIFICLLAYYVEWHLRQVLAPLLFDDERLATDRKRRDPVAPAEPSAAAKAKKVERVTEAGLPIHSFNTLMIEMGTRCRHRCRVKSDPQCPPIFQDTEPTPLQTRALELTRLLPVQGI